MEVELLPTQFLNVVLEESDRKNSTATEDLHVMSRLPSSLTIFPVIPKSPRFQNKNINGKYSKKIESLKISSKLTRKNDYLALKKRLPRTVLEECIVELASSEKRSDVIPVSGEDAIIIEPMYSKKPKAWGNREKNTVDLPDIFNQVEVVYSDDDEPSNLYEVNGSSLCEPAAESINMLPYACDYCPNKYLSKGASWQHSGAAHNVDKSCECRLCGRKFYRNCSLALHMKCHSDEQNCSCKICGKEFNRLSTLERHAKCHRSELPIKDAVWFTCNVCDRKLSDEATLKMHIMSSHSQKYTCDQCNVTFNTKQLLNLHFHITHKRSETPFACKLCKAKFANLRELNEHSLSHTFQKSRISCHHCGEVFTQRCTYKKHLQLHIGERLSCTICKIDFTHRSSLLRHYKRLHFLNDIPHTPSNAEPPNLIAITK